MTTALSPFQENTRSFEILVSICGTEWIDRQDTIRLAILQKHSPADLRVRLPLSAMLPLLHDALWISTGAQLGFLTRWGLGVLLGTSTSLLGASCRCNAQR